MLESKFLNYQTLRAQLDYLNNYNANLLVPVLIDCSPVMLLSTKPYYLCVYKDESGEFKLCYTSSLRLSRIIIKDIPLSRLQEFIDKESFVNVTKDVSVQGNYVTSTGYYTSLGKSKIGALYITTGHDEHLRELLKNSRDTITDVDNDAIVSYLIWKQSKLDAFMRIIDNFTNEYKAMAMLNGTFMSNFSIDGQQTELSLMASGTDVIPSKETIDGIDACKGLSSYISSRVTNLEDEQDYYLGPIMSKCEITFNVVAMAISREDYGRDSISGLDRYQITRNEFLVCLVGNDHLYRRLFKNRLNSIYSSRYDIDVLTNEIKVFYRHKEGKVPFRDILTGVAFKG